MQHKERGGERPEDLAQGHPYPLIQKALMTFSIFERYNLRRRNL